MLLTPLIALTLCVGDAKLMEAQKLLEAHDCDGLATLFRKVNPGQHERDLEYARVLVQGATECRKVDALLSLDLAQKAARLAPTDYGVTTAEAEAFLAVDQRTEAAKVLDDTIQDHPAEAARARLLRGRLAVKEHDFAIALQVLKPIEDDSQYGAEAKTLYAQAEQGAQSEAQARAQLSQEEAQVEANSAKAAQVAKARPKELRRMTHSGSVVWSGKGTIKNGGSKTFTTRYINAGEDYVLHLNARCTAPKARSSGRGRRRRGRMQEPPETFGLDFDAHVGSLDPIPIDIGLDSGANDLPFRAAEDNPQIRIDDETDTRVNVKCQVSDVSVRVP